MPERFLIPVSGIHAGGGDPAWIHALAASWLDAAHWQSPKPWSVVPPRLVDGLPCIEVGVLTTDAATRLMAATLEGASVRLGAASGRVVAPPHRVAAESWADLAQGSGVTMWDLALVTPTSFRRRHHYAPWPDPSAVLRSLSQRWEAYAQVALPRLIPKDVAQVRVDDVAGEAFDMRIPTGTPGRAVTVKGFMGQIVFSCLNQQVADIVDSLLRFGEYAGVGSYPTHGLGTLRVIAQ